MKSAVNSGSFWQFDPGDPVGLVDVGCSVELPRGDGLPILSACQTFFDPFLLQMTLFPGPSPAVAPNLVQEVPMRVLACTVGLALTINPIAATVVMATSAKRRASIKGVKQNVKRNSMNAVPTLKWSAVVDWQMETFLDSYPRIATVRHPIERRAE
ncbi:MAG: hypothetical protein HY050_09315 [Actinobacteria bacterium]|nr:hypothetical protein [Actinomycetota bacterium]